MGMLDGKQVAVVAADGFDERGVLESRQALEEAGAAVHVVSLAPGALLGWRNGSWVAPIVIDRTVDAVRAVDYDGVLLPGGVMSADALRLDHLAIALVRQAFDLGSPIGAIGHALWMLVDAGVLDGFRVTSWPSIRTDVTNAGAIWVDAEVVVHHAVVTSRKPADTPTFARRFVEEIARGRSTRRRSRDDASDCGPSTTSRWLGEPYPSADRDRNPF
jgi:protease I